MICISYIVNDNYKVARLGKEAEVQPCYIIETDSTDTAHLFSFEHMISGFDPDLGFESDASYQIDQQQSKVVSDSANHHAEITLVLKRQELGENANLNDVTINKLDVRGSEVFFDLGTIGHRTDLVSTIHVNLVVKDDDDELRYQFSLNVADKEHIFDIVIDFGSEASQIWYVPRDLNTAHNSNQMPLFKEIKRNSSLASVNDKEIYQYEPDDITLYRSLFFIKDNISSITIKKSDLTFINREADLMTMLTSGGEVALPNMKIMDYSSVRVPYITLNKASMSLYHISQEIRSQILKFLFETVLKNIKLTAQKQMVTCKITFLVPNTYTQAMLSDIHFKLIEDVKSSLTAIQPSGGQQEGANFITGDIEVATFSESDASFFGKYDAGNFNQTDEGKRILIVDIGKGTTDFSVLRISSSPETGITMERMARSGIIGAGNVITFAVLASIMNQIAKKLNSSSSNSDILRAIQRIAYHSDRAKKNELYRNLEQLKCRRIGENSLSNFIGNYNYTSATGTPAIGSVTIEKLTDILKEANTNNCIIDEDDCVINAYASQLASLLIEKIKFVYHDNIKLDEVIFSGRGSKSNILTKMILDALLQINKHITVRYLDDADKKSACLKGPFNKSMQFDRMNMNIVGWPRLKDNYSSPEIRENGNRINSGHIGRRIKEFFIKIKSKLIKVEHSPGDQVNDPAIEFVKGQRIADFDHAETWQKVQGSHIKDVKAGTNTFMIGCHRFSYNHSPMQGEVRIYFDGKDFLLRLKSRSIRFRPGNDSDQEKLITETLFPVTECVSGPQPEMPVLNDVLATCGISGGRTNDSHASKHKLSSHQDYTEKGFEEDESDFDADE